MNIFTIGFTKKTAESFFENLKASGATRLVDVRLNNVSQLAGFAKREDLRYFLREICDMQYEHLPLLAPTQELLSAYQKRLLTWEEYAARFLALMEERRVQEVVSPSLLDSACLLCSEDQPNKCHRRLVAEYLRDQWGDVDITHLPDRKVPTTCS